MLRVFRLLVLVSMCCCINASAMDIKEYHKPVFTDDKGKVNCKACHTDKFTIPKASTCESCHGSPQEVAKLTERPNNAGHQVEPNPHDSLHYGTDMPCTYCHQEHKPSEVYCNDCHEFKYPDMKR